MFSWIGSILSIIASALGIAKKTQELNNTPEMQAAAKAKLAKEKEDEAEKAIQNGNVIKTGKLVS